MTITAAARLERVLAEVPKGLLIGGWTESRSGQTIDVLNPATGDVLAAVEDGTPEDGIFALDAAVRSASEWARKPPRHRSDILLRAYEILMSRAEDFAVLMTAEMGKSLSESRVELSYGADYVRWYAEEALRINGRITISPDARAEISTSYEPVGPTLIITPWNFPFAMGARKIAPALAAGCTVVMKPPALTPLTSLYLAKAFLDAGVPEGVINVVTTSSSSTLSERVMADPRLRKVSFTGSTDVGRRLFSQSAENFLKMSLELGGNAPLIVFADADVEQAAIATAHAKLRNSGQTCIAPNRILVEDSVADEFVERMLAELRQFTLGNGLDAETTHGPLITAREQEKCEAMVAEAIDDGATLLYESRLPDLDGSFMPITLLDHVNPQSRLCHEEIFGPVAAVTRFSTESDAIRMANDTPYGLASYVFTQDIDRARRLSRALSAGMVGINQAVVTNVAAPFGGIKHSGTGREGGPEGLLEYLTLKYLATSITASQTS